MSPGRTASTAEIVDATLLAARNAELDLALRVQNLQRLSEWATDKEASLSVRFYMADRRVGVDGRAEALLKLTCQRCLEPLVEQVADEFHVVIVESESEADGLAEQQEAIVADPTRLDLGWLLEEQLLLAMPLVPLHREVAQCSIASAEVRTESARRRSKAEPTQRPFAGLRDLMVTDDKK